MRWLNNIQWYLENRFISKTHLLPNRLPKGQFHEMHDRVLHASFEALVDWVEIECASHYMAWHDVKQPFFHRRHPGYGMAHLVWELTLTEESAEQAAVAAEVIDHYLWWKNERPARKDPWDGTWYENGEVRWEKAERVGREYTQEDQERLCRLSKLLDSLWL